MQDGVFRDKNLNMMQKYETTLIESGSYDVIVVGSGSAGSPAAIAAARAGAKTLVLERLPFLGGTSTAVLDTFYGYYTPGTKSIKVVGGIADDVVAGLEKHNASFNRPNSFGAGTGITYHPEYLKVVWEKLVSEAGCDILLNAWVQDVIKEGTKVTGLVVATKNGLKVFKGKQIIDASGDADICFQAGLPYELAGDIDPAQTLTTTFKMVNVDVEKRKTISKPEVNALMEKAAATGNYKLPRKEGSDHITPVDHMTATIMTRLTSFKKNDEGKVIFESGTRDDQNFIQPGSFMFKAEAVDQYGNLIDKHNLWEMVGVRFNRSMFPGFSDQADFSFSCPAEVNAKNMEPEERQAFKFDATKEDITQLNVTAKLKYRKIDQYLVNYLFGDHSGITTPITIISEDTKSIVVEANNATIDKNVSQSKALENSNSLARSNDPVEAEKLN